VEGGIGGVAGGAAHDAGGGLDGDLPHQWDHPDQVVGSDYGMLVAHRRAAIVTDRHRAAVEMVLGGAVVAVHGWSSSEGKKRRRAHKET
jgi:hypothetical protein